MKRTVKISIFTLWCFAWTLYQIGSQGVNILQWNQRIVQIPLYLFYGISLLMLIGNFNKCDSKSIIWYSIFTVICFVSSIYAIESSYCHDMVKPIITGLLFCVCMETFISYDIKAIRIIKIVVILSNIVIGVLAIENFSQTFAWTRLGDEIGRNPNLIGLSFLTSFCFSIELRKERQFKLLCYLSMIVSLYVVLLTGSKKAILGILVYLVVYSLIKEKKYWKKILVVSIIVIFAYFGFTYILSNNLLNGIIGKRLVDMLNTFVFGGGTSYSTDTRMDMISRGFSFFIQHPIFGCGINNFRHLFGVATGFATYAHNNYIEILVDLGLLGFFAFYSYHLSIFRKIKSVMNKQSVAGSIALFAVLIFYDLAMVSYENTYIITLLIMTYHSITDRRKAEIEEPVLDYSSAIKHE